MHRPGAFDKQLRLPPGTDEPDQGPAPDGTELAGSASDRAPTSRERAEQPRDAHPALTGLEIHGLLGDQLDRHTQSARLPRLWSELLRLLRGS
jgi:hypothetical protein